MLDMAREVVLITLCVTLTAAVAMAAAWLIARAVALRTSRRRCEIRVAARRKADKDAETMNLIAAALTDAQAELTAERWMHRADVEQRDRQIKRLREQAARWTAKGDRT